MGELVGALDAIERACLLDPGRGGGKVLVQLQRLGDQELELGIPEELLPGHMLRGHGVGRDFAGKARGHRHFRRAIVGRQIAAGQAPAKGGHKDDAHRLHGFSPCSSALACALAASGRRPDHLLATI
ncbi:hypothetical protein D3C85_1380870 [compost metagenome]